MPGNKAKAVPGPRARKLQSPGGRPRRLGSGAVRPCARTGRVSLVEATVSAWETPGFHACEMTRARSPPPAEPTKPDIGNVSKGQRAGDTTCAVHSRAEPQPAPRSQGTTHCTADGGTNEPRRRGCRPPSLRNATVPFCAFERVWLRVREKPGARCQQTGIGASPEAPRRWSQPWLAARRGVLSLVCSPCGWPLFSGLSPRGCKKAAGSPALSLGLESRGKDGQGRAGRTGAPSMGKASALSGILSRGVAYSHGPERRWWLLLAARGQGDQDLPNRGDPAAERGGKRPGPFATLAAPRKSSKDTGHAGP